MATEKNSGITVWKIAGGVVLGLLIFSALEQCASNIRTRQVMEQIKEANAQSREKNRLRIAQRRQQAQAQQPIRNAKPVTALRPGERCIDGERLQRLENGWKEVGSC